MGYQPPPRSFDLSRPPREARAPKIVLVVVVLGVLVAVFFPQIRQLLEPVEKALQP